MRPTLTFLAFAAAVAVAWPSSAQAQPNATIVLASGDRISGQLVDLNGSGFQMTVRGEARSIPRGDVAVIDFIGNGRAIPAGETARMQGGRTLVYLRSGDYFYGTLYDIGQRDPLLITVQTPDGERRVMSNQVGRIYLRNWPGMPQGGGTPTRGGRGGGPASPTSRTVIVQANRAWTTTGITVQQGQMVSFDANGEIRLSGNANDRARAGGSLTNRIGGRGAPRPADPAGALLGRIGQNAPFGIGNQTQPLPMPQSGVLLLGINDANPGDNSGQYSVEVDPAPPATTPSRTGSGTGTATERAPSQGGGRGGR